MIRRWILICSIVAVLFGIAAKPIEQANAISHADQQARIQWRETIKEIFNWDRSSVFKESEILEMLRQAQKLYRGLEDVSEYEQKTFCEIGELIEAHKIAVDARCDLGTFKMLARLLLEYRYTYSSVYAYVRSNFEKHFLKCENDLITNLSDSIDRIPAETKSELKLLVGSILDAANRKCPPDCPSNSALKEIDEYELHKGLPEFLRPRIYKRPINITDEESDRQLFKEKFIETVGSLCSVVIGNLRQPIQVYEVIVKDVTMAELLDESVLKWITNARVCDRISMKLDKIIEINYNIFLSTNQLPPKKTSRLKGLLTGCLKEGNTC